jgi:hypothetical protein
MGGTGVIPCRRFFCGAKRFGNGRMKLPPQIGFSVGAAGPFFYHRS